MRACGARVDYRRPVDGPTLWERVRRVNPLVWDSLLAAVALMLTALSVTLGPLPEGREEPDLLGWALVMVACVSIAFRRRSPLVVLGVVAGSSAVFALLGYRSSLDPPLVVAMYTAAAYLPRRGVAIVALPVAVAAALPIQLRTPTTDNWLEVVLGIFFAVGLPILVGRIMFNRRRRLARERKQAAIDAVTDERARIARELHDVVAHAMSVMVVQAGAARTVIDRDAGAAKEALATIEDAGREGLTEMRRLIGVLTTDWEGADLEPQPNLQRLDELLAGVRSAGLPVELVREGTPRPLLAGVDLAAYRVIQESLTNALKHAGPAHARVVLRYRDDDLEIVVEDDGRGTMLAAGTGHGLIGMHERVSMFGGTLDTGNRAGGGFSVRATIPTREDT